MRKFIEQVSGKYQLELRPNRDVENSFHAYETSFETERLESERNREIYCELIDLSRKEKLEKLGDIQTTKADTDKSLLEVDDSEERVVIESVGGDKQWWTEVSVKTNQVKTLVEIVARKIAEGFSCGAADGRIQGVDAVDFGRLADVRLPVEDVLELDNEIFWQRYLEAIIQKTYKLKLLLNSSPTSTWKTLGIEAKLAEIIQNLQQKEFSFPSTKFYLENLAEKLKDIIENLSIESLKPRESIVKNPLNPESRVMNVPSQDCLHGSLNFLQRLHRLKKLSINFNPGELGSKYERRFMKISINDVEILADVLKSLKDLESLRIHCSLNESEKLQKLLAPLQTMENLKFIDFSFCGISSGDSGKNFKNFFSVNRNLESLELKGNLLDKDFCEVFAEGIESFNGNLQFLGLSHNPILGNGLCKIIKAIRKKNNVAHLDISCCDNFFREYFPERFQEIIELIESAGAIRIINMNAITINDLYIRENFINALNVNYELDELLCANCGFGPYEMMQIQTLLYRNKYFKDYPILRKQHLTAEDEVEIEKILRRTKHYLLLKHKKIFEPPEEIGSQFI